MRGDRFPQVRGLAGLAVALGTSTTALLDGLDVPMSIRVEAETLEQAYARAAA
jgi:hypothetical protein